MTQSYEKNSRAHSQNVPTCCLNSSWSFDSSIWHKVGWNEFVPVFDSKLFWWVLTLECLRLDRCHSMVPDFLKGKGNIWESRRWHLADGGPTNLPMLLLLSSVLFLGAGWHLKQHPIIKPEVHFGSSMIQPTMGGSAPEMPASFSPLKSLCPLHIRQYMVRGAPVYLTEEQPWPCWAVWPSSCAVVHIQHTYQHLTCYLSQDVSLLCPFNNHGPVTRTTTATTVWLYPCWHGTYPWNTANALTFSLCTLRRRDTWFST